MLARPQLALSVSSEVSAQARQGQGSVATLQAWLQDELPRSHQSLKGSDTLQTQEAPGCSQVILVARV